MTRAMTRTMNDGNGDGGDDNDNNDDDDDEDKISENVEHTWTKKIERSASTCRTCFYSCAYLPH